MINRCSFGFHKWGKWIEPYETYDSWTRIILAQDRQCKLCNLVQTIARGKPHVT